MDVIKGILCLLCEKKASIDMWRIVLMAILCMQLVACSAADDLLGKVGIATTTPINEALAACNLHTSPQVQVKDYGHSLLMYGEVNPSLSNALDNTYASCVLRELGFPAYIAMLIRHTRPLDGMQREEFDSNKIYWGNDSDNFVIIIHMK